MLLDHFYGFSYDHLYLMYYTFLPDNFTATPFFLGNCVRNKFVNAAPSNI